MGVFTQKVALLKQCSFILLNFRSLIEYRQPVPWRALCFDLIRRLARAEVQLNIKVIITLNIMITINSFLLRLIKKNTKLKMKMKVGVVSNNFFEILTCMREKKRFGVSASD